MKEICETLEIAPSTIQRRLKKLGYEWNNSTKIWEWNHEENQPLNVDITESTTGKIPGKRQGGNRENTQGNNNITNGNEKITANYKKITDDNEEITKVDEFAFTSTFTKREIAILKEIAKERLETKNENTESAFFRRLRTLGKIETEAKTIKMSKEAGEKLNKFTEQYGVNKQHVLTIALMDFFDKYGE